MPLKNVASQLKGVIRVTRHPIQRPSKCSCRAGVKFLTVRKTNERFWLSVIVHGINGKNVAGKFCYVYELPVVRMNYE